MTSFYYRFLAQIKAFVTYTPLGLPNLNMWGKTKRILVLVVDDAIVQIAYSARSLAD